MVDNRDGKLLQGKSLVKTRRTMTVPSPVCQRAQAANIMCPNWGDNMSLGYAIHTRFQSQFLNGGQNRCVEIQGFGNRHDLAEGRRDGLIHYGEIKPNSARSVQQGRLQLGNVPQQNILNGIQFAPIPLRAIDPLAWVIPGYVHPILINIFNQVVGNGLQNQAMALFQNLPGNQNIIMNEAPNRQGLYVYQGI